ncbi:MAG: Glu/Leu/Phe/Val dehydrogenase, partial [Deinococcus sp.]|nr:Glu/Leu/Phe/Val dehydrogenase [Deinococcus sp.]
MSLPYLPPGNWGLWGEFLDRIERTIPYLRLDLASLEYLRNPRRVLVVAVPTKLDDGSVKFFTGYRVQHSIARGPAKGGIR